MSLRTEVVDAWRALRYDVRRQVETSCTHADVMYPEYDAYARRPRRMFTAGRVAVLAVGGVIGTYLALAGGLGSLILGPSTSDPASGNEPTTAAVRGAGHPGPAGTPPAASPQASATSAPPHSAGGPATSRSRAPGSSPTSVPHPTTSPTPGTTPSPGDPSSPAPTPSTPDPSTPGSPTGSPSTTPTGTPSTAMPDAA